MLRSIHLAALVVLVGVIGGNVALAEDVAPEVIDIQVSPSTINLAFEGELVTVHASIPLAGVTTGTLYLNGVPVWYTKADSRGELVAKFKVADVMKIIAVPSAELKLVGDVHTSVGPIPFFGTDTVRVVDVSGKNR